MLTPDIKPQWKEALKQWLNITRMIQSQGRKQRGYAIVDIRVVVNQDGVPVWWTKNTDEIQPISKMSEILEQL